MISSLINQFRNLNLHYSNSQLHTFRTDYAHKKSRIEETLRASSVLSPGKSLEDFLQTNKLADAGEKLFTVFERATSFLAKAGAKYGDSCQMEKHRKQFLYHVSNFELILGSPILTNAGRRSSKSISACSVPPVKLSSMTKAEIATIVGDYHTRGMGTGFCLDDVTDPVEMVQYLNHIAISEVQRGQIERSVGNMGVLSIDHPKVLAFIRVKQDNPQIKEWKFNLSVNITERFIVALQSKEPFILKNGAAVDPAVLMHQIAESAHATGDPGLIFMDRLNRLNRVPQAGKLSTVVPCGEVSLLDGEVCQFSYLNLPQFVKNNKIDKDALRQAVHAAVLLLDNAVEANVDRVPNETSAEIISSVRRIGIGVCGFAELLQASGMAYDSPQARKLAEDLMSFINFESKWASVMLAKERGPFKLFDHPETRTELFIDPFKANPTDFVPAQDWERLEKHFREHKIRNLATTILPPTGRSSLIAGVTGSIEPPFRLVLDSAFKEALQTQSLAHSYLGDIESFYENVKTSGSIQNTALPQLVKQIFKTALEIAPQDHLLMTAAFQKHTDEGISKTVNLPSHATVDDVAKIFSSAYNLQLKGVTIYRDGSCRLQPKVLNQDPSMTSEVVVDRIYGRVRVSKRIAGLLNSNLVMRLKHVHQNGASFLIDKRQSTSRYEHSVGVLALTQMLGGDESKQIASLLHDISHTAFSHVIDLVFAKRQQNYHDLMRDKFLTSPFAQKTIKELSITPYELSCESIAMIKGKGLNADRLDYAIRDLLSVNRLFQPEYSSILNNLIVDDDGEIKCKNIDTARLVFNKFLEANLEIYFDPKAEVASLTLATILKTMLEQGLLVEEDFFSTDDELIAKILASPFNTVFKGIGPDMQFSISQSATQHPATLRKLRFVNPMIIGMPGLLTDHCQQSKERLHSYLNNTPTQVFYQIPILEQLP